MSLGFLWSVELRQRSHGPDYELPQLLTSLVAEVSLRDTKHFHSVDIGAAH